jgi:diguanylate cyclase
MTQADDRFRRTLTAGEMLFAQGDAGDCAYLIESGTIEIFTETQGRRTVIARLGRDEILGEMMLAGDRTRSATVQAVEPTVLSVITQERLSEHLERADPLLRHLLNVTLARARDNLRRARSLPVDEQRAPAPLNSGETGARVAALQRLRLEQDLELALQSHEFQLHYQPLTRLADARVAGFESLIRWQRADGQRIPPDQFIGVAEDSGFIVKLGHWIIRTACAGLRQLQDLHSGQDVEPLFVTINLSIRQFRDPDLFEVLRTALAQNRLAPGRVKLEITESLVMGNMDDSLALLRRCKEIGCRLAIDDFGTGYSSLSYLHKFPVDVLKLDRSFVREIHSSEPARKIVRAVARMAQDLGMETVVEGVETAEQVDACRAVGIELAQGWYYCKALPLAEAAEYLRKNAGAS